MLLLNYNFLSCVLNTNRVPIFLLIPFIRLNGDQLDVSGIFLAQTILGSRGIFPERVSLNYSSNLEELRKKQTKQMTPPLLQVKVTSLSRKSDKKLIISCKQQITGKLQNILSCHFHVKTINISYIIELSDMHAVLKNTGSLETHCTCTRQC